MRGVMNELCTHTQTYTHTQTLVHLSDSNCCILRRCPTCGRQRDRKKGRPEQKKRVPHHHTVCFFFFSCFEGGAKFFKGYELHIMVLCSSGVVSAETCRRRRLPRTSARKSANEIESRKVGVVFCFLRSWLPSFYELSS